MIYHDVADRPQPLRAYPAALVALAVAGPVGLALARWSPPGGQLALALLAGGGLVRSRHLAGVRRRIPIAALCVALVIGLGESGTATWTWSPLWFALAVAADARWLEVSWPRLHLPWRGLLRGVTGIVLGACALGVLVPGRPAWLDLLAAGTALGLVLAAASSGLWHPAPRELHLEGRACPATRHRCPRCGTIADWPVDRPGTCHRCGLKRRAEAPAPRSD